MDCNPTEPIGCADDPRGDCRRLQLKDTPHGDGGLPRLHFARVRKLERCGRGKWSLTRQQRELAMMIDSQQFRGLRFSCRIEHRDRDRWIGDETVSAGENEPLFRLNDHPRGDDRGLGERLPFTRKVPQLHERWPHAIEPFPC